MCFSSGKFTAGPMLASGLGWNPFALARRAISSFNLRCWYPPAKGTPPVSAKHGPVERGGGGVVYVRRQESTPARNLFRPSLGGVVS